MNGFPKLPNPAVRQPFEEDIEVAPPGQAKAQGRLHYDPEDGLLAQLSNGWLSGIREVERWPALQGETFSGRVLTLLDTFTREWQASADRGRARIWAGMLAVGVEIESPEELRFKQISFGLRGMRDWLSGGWSQLSPALQPSSASDYKYVNVSIQGVTLQFFLEKRPSGGGRYRWTEETISGVNICAPEAIPINRWHSEWIDPVRDLMTFANREVAIIERLSGSAEPDSPESVQIFEQAEAVVRPRTNFSFYQRDLLPAGIIDTAELIQRWFDLHASIGPSSALFFGTLNSRGLPVENRFLNLMAFAEGYHRLLHNEPPLEEDEHRTARETMIAALPHDERMRRHYRLELKYANRQSQRERMRWLVERAELETWPRSLAAKIVSRCCDTRNWLTHWGEKGRHVVGDADLAELTRQLTFVIEANLLDDLLKDDEQVCQCLALGYVWDSPFWQPNREE